MTRGKTYNKSPRRINHKATKSKTNTKPTALERSVEQTTGEFKALLQLANFTLGPDATLNTEIHKNSVRIKAPNTYKARFFANSSLCTTTVLSKLLTSCLTAVKKHWIRYYDTVYERDGINYFWSIKNSIDVLNKFKSKNSPRWGLNPRPPGLQSDGASN